MVYKAKLFNLLTILLFTASISNAQNYPKIEFEKMSHDFGEIKEINGVAAYDFKFVNKGKVPFKIDSVKPSCGCTSPDFSKEPVMPGKSGFIRVIYDPTNKDGSFNETIIIESNAMGKISLSIIGSVISKPRTLLDDYPVIMGNLRFKVHHVVLGEVFRNSIDTGYIYVYNPGNNIVRIVGFRGPEHIRGENSPIFLQPKEMRAIEIYFSSFLKPDLGYNFDRIYMLVDDSNMPEMEFVVVANVVNNYTEMSEEELKNAPKIDFTKTIHDFGSVYQGQVVTTEFPYTNKGKDQLVIYETKAACGCTAMTLGRSRIEAGEESVIKVVYDTKGKMGKTSESILVRTNDPNQPEIYLYIKAEVRTTK